MSFDVMSDLYVAAVFGLAMVFWLARELAIEIWQCEWGSRKLPRRSFDP
jgi:hypothetical protein